MIKAKASLASWMIPPAILLVYLCFPTKVYYWDGIAFAQMIEDAPRLNASLLHPNHLFYNVVGYLIYRAVQALGIHARALQVLQVTNSILSAVCAYLLFQILRRSIRSLYLCSALVFLFAFSATWWRFSTDADAYIPSVLLMLVSFYLILPSQKPRPLLLALVFSLSMCLHQLAVVFFPVLVLALYFQTSSLTSRQRLITILKFSVAAFLITFGAYYYCFYLATGTLDFKRLLRWTTSFSPDASFSFNAASNLGYTLRGFWRLFFGGRFNALKGLMNPFIVALFIVLAALLILFGRALVRGLKSAKFRGEPALKFAAQFKPLLWLCALWVLVYTAFLFVWLPQNTFYRLFYFPALIILAGLLLASSESIKTRPRTYRAALLVAMVSLFNFLFLIFPSAHVQKYPPLSLALEMNQVWPRGTVVYYAFENSDNSLFHYFNPSATWKPLKSIGPGELESELQNIYAQGGAAWLDVFALEQISSTPEGTAWLATHAREHSRREVADPAYKIKFVQIVP